MDKIKIEAMEEKIKDILEKHYYGRNFIEDKCAKELLALFSVSNRYSEKEMDAAYDKGRYDEKLGDQLQDLR